MWLPALLVFSALGVLSMRGVRWAYITFVLLGLLYFPLKAGFRFDPRPCELTPTMPLLIHSLTNYPHIVLFALFFIMTSGQMRAWNRRALGWAALATMGMGALVELSQGVTGEGNCRLRDLIPDAAGILVGSVVVLAWGRIRGRRQAA